VGAVSDQVDKARVGVGIVAQRAAAPELDMRRQQTSVDDVGIGADTALGVIDVIRRVCGLVGDRTQTPWRVGLCGQLVELPDGVLLYGGDLARVLVRGSNGMSRRVG
jgi:hypothetical protein